MDTLGKRAIATACGLACTVLSIPASATVTYTSPGSFAIASVVNDNVLINHTQAIVTLQSNGRVQGLDTLSPVYREAAVRVQRGTLEMTGNTRVIAGLNQSGIEMTTSDHSDVRIGGRAAVHGNIKADFAVIWTDEATATQRLYLQETGVVSGDVTFGGFVRLQDQAVVSGTIRGAMNANLRLDMVGGFVGGSVSLGGLDNHMVNMSGGTIAGSLGGAPSYVEINISGGYIRQGLRSSGAYDGVIRGGYIDGGVAITNYVAGGSNLTVRGGRFETTASDWLFALTEQYSDNSPSTLKVCGGQFGYYEPGTGVLIDGKTNLQVYGAGLTYSGGVLSGTLQDGSPINVALTFGPSWTGTFTITPVAVGKPTC
ncbi:hypothetical protein ACFPN2_25215 [Steroidobacter flavus]|uniref:Uncharacterized protein n=1 Tax=Steroidobacter flavus TaxID=1842136 RepID=A0ABV8SZM7_9GAMM